MNRPTLEELLEKELIWERQDGEIDLFTWWDQGIRLYRQLSGLEPKNERYKIQLANLLLKAGGDLKLKQHNYSLARQLFRQLTRMEPEHAMAHYRLGFLHYYLHEGEASIRHFEKALRAVPIKRSHQIHSEHRIKAMCYLAKAYQKLSLSIFEQANQLFEAVTDPVVVDCVDPFMEETRKDLFVFGETKPFVMVTQDSALELHEEDVIRYQMEKNAHNEICLNLLGEIPCLMSPSGSCLELSEQLARLLRFLMESKRAVTTQTIKESLFPDSKSDSIVRRTIHRLRRETLMHAFLPDYFIQTTNQGYQLNWPGTFKIFYRKDDIFLKEFL